MKTKRICLLACLLALSSAVVAAANVVIIMADDLGWNAVGYHNPEVKTPHLDRLCREGVELDQFYVSPMYSPTRAGCMTGRDPIRFGCARSVILPWRNFGVPTDEIMLPEALGKAGYGQRGAFGKWHLCHAQRKWLPGARGFTEFLGCYNGAHGRLYLYPDEQYRLVWRSVRFSRRPDSQANSKSSPAIIHRSPRVTDRVTINKRSSMPSPHSLRPILTMPIHSKTLRA